MSSVEQIEKIKQDLLPIKKYWMVVHGSVIRNEATRRSDIDIAIITKSHSRKKNKKIWQEIIEYNRAPYDIKIFELLPLHIQIQIIQQNVIIYGDKYELSEYWYFYRKLWKDMKHRYFNNLISSIFEKKEGIQRWKQFLNSRIK